MECTHIGTYRNVKILVYKIKKMELFYFLDMEAGSFLDIIQLQMKKRKNMMKRSYAEQWELEEITYRTMMGEFILYYRGKIVGGIYDDRLLVKPVKSAVRYMPTAPYELPYDGAKRMLLVEEVDNKKFLTGLFDAMYAELPAPKQKRGK